MELEEAIKDIDDGILLKLEIIPGSKENHVPYAYNSWRKTIQVKITEEPKCGKANLQLIDVLASFFGVKQNKIEIIKGLKNHRKTIKIKDISYNSVIKKLIDAL
ncbi:DUF167 domain-containing protein [Methanosalsum natronophilum]|uniref:DUF167 domain-containing protein n=1 Tax=Methanosalsum natronophilum TaxID=768733 RepID=UPI0021677631|nr:DUF167 domain-containing protein [Methanosalsum natronophilum]MCS3923510.1 uncharacterized protein (TIGR00251 family) [Methanosalsum natronophilum]